MTISARVEVLRNGVRFRDLLFDTEQPPRLVCSSETDIKTSFSGEFLCDPEVDLCSDELRPVVAIDGAETPCGVFLAATVSKIRNDDGDEWMAIEAYDRCWRVQSTRTENILHLSAGMNYIDAVKLLLSRCGIALVVAAPTDAVLATDREDWDIGTDYLTIINQLLDECNYANLWFDSVGFARLEPEKIPTAANIVRSYRADDIRGVVTAAARVETDLFSAPNHFVVICSNPELDGSPWVARALNDNPQSKLSTVVRGRKITQVTKLDSVASIAELQTYANLLAAESMIQSETIQLSTLPEPGHGVGEIIALTHPSLDGVCVEVGWELSLGRELMIHKLRKVVYAVG